VRTNRADPTVPRPNCPAARRSCNADR
jgi:hypothetical protein